MVFVQFSYGGYHVLTKRALLHGATRSRARRLCWDWLTPDWLAGGVNMYVFCAARDVIALLCLATVHAAMEGGLGRRLLGSVERGYPSTASPRHAAPPETRPQPPPRRLLLWCAALGFAGVFANQLLFLKARALGAAGGGREPFAGDTRRPDARARRRVWSSRQRWLLRGCSRPCLC
jgi:hypothetical protein